MTLIWPFKVIKGQTDFDIGFATFHFLYVFYSNCSAISQGNPIFQQMTLIWPFKVTKGQTDCAIGFGTYHFLYVFYSNYSAISHGNPVFQQMTLIWLSKVTKGQTDNAIWFATYHFLYVFYSNYSAMSHGNPVFQQMTLFCLPRSPKVKLIMPSDSRHIISYMCFIVTIALSRPETLFFSWWPRSVLSVTKRQTDYPPASGRKGLEFYNLRIKLFHSFYICMSYAKWFRLERSIIIIYRRIYLSLAAARCKYWLILKF